MAIKVYYAPMSSASPVMWALEELGIDYEAIELDIRAGTHKTPELLSANPMGQVPTLVDNGQGIFESTAIIIHLGERYGVDRGLWPEVGSPAHMQALTWLLWTGVTLGSTLRQAMLNGGRWLPEEARSSQQLQMAQERLDQLMDVLEGRLRDRQYLVGDQFTLVDAYAAAGVAWGLGEAGYDLSGHPCIDAWRTRCLDRPASSAMSE